MDTSRLPRTLRRLTAAVIAIVLFGACTDNGSTTETRQPDGAAAVTPAPAAEPVTTLVGPGAGSYAGRTSERNTLIGLVTDGADVMVYFCDGAARSLWFRGPVQQGRATLTNAAGATLEATVDGTRARGRVGLDDGTVIDFDAPVARGDAGLFRRVVTTDGVRELTGWIVLDDGTTTGLTEFGIGTPTGPGTVVGGPVSPVASTTPTSSPTTTSTSTSTTTRPNASTTTTRPNASTTTASPSTGARPGLPPGVILDLPSPLNPPRDLRVDIDGVTPQPTPNRGDLRFVIAAMGDSFAAGEGAPDVNGQYAKPDLRECRDEANQLSQYSEAEFAVLGRISTLASRSFAVAGPAATSVADLTNLLRAYRAAEQAVARTAQTARAAADAVAALQRGDISGSLSALQDAVIAADRAVANARAAFVTASSDLLAKAQTVRTAVVAVLGSAITSSDEFIGTGRSGPFAAIGFFDARFSATLRYATFWVAYTGCNARPPVRTGRREEWFSAFTQSRPSDPAGRSVVDSDARRCHRSMNAPAALAATQLARDLPDVNVVFKSFACSGAKTEHIDLVGYNGVEFTVEQFRRDGQLPPQIDQLATWARANGISDIDSLYLGIGGNDAGFGLIILQCLLPYLDVVGATCDQDPAGFANPASPALVALPSRFAAMHARLDALDTAAALRATTGIRTNVGVNPLATSVTLPNLDAAELRRRAAEALPGSIRIVNRHVPELPDPTRDQAQVPCAGEIALSPNDRDLTDRFGPAEGRFAADTLVPLLNGLISDAARRAGFSLLTGMSQSFRPHGFCSSDPWLNENRIGTARQDALIGKSEVTGFPTAEDIRLMTGPAAQLIPASGPATPAGGVETIVAVSVGGTVLPFLGMHLSFGMIHPNPTGYQLGYQPPTLAAFRQDARERFTPIAPDQFRADLAGAGAVVLRWRDRADNERSYRVRAVSNATACGLPTARALPADTQRISVSVTPGTTCEYRVQACGIALAGEALCSAEVSTRIAVPAQASTSSTSPSTSTSTSTSSTSTSSSTSSTSTSSSSTSSTSTSSSTTSSTPTSTSTSPSVVTSTTVVSSTSIAPTTVAGASTTPASSTTSTVPTTVAPTTTSPTTTSPTTTSPTTTSPTTTSPTTVAPTTVVPTTVAPTTTRRV